MNHPFSFAHISKTMQHGIRFALLVTMLLIVSGCGGYSGPTPLEQISNKFKSVNTFSAVLADAKEEDGKFFQKFYITPQGSETPQETQWMETTEEDFSSTLPFLGMTVFQKMNGQETLEAAPPGYEYVGNPQYGSWHSNSSGGSFWMFYGQYRLMSDLLGWGRINQRDYYAYQTNRQNGRPYYGPNKEYGLNGAKTKVKNKTFFDRAQSKQSMKRASFSNKVQSRVGRSSVSVRSRGIRAGK